MTKKRRDYEQELQEFRKKQRKKLKHIRQQAQVKVARLHEKIFTTILWSIPCLPSTYRKLVMEYCDHLMGPFPESPFPRWNVLIAWQKKFECSPEAKVTQEIQYLLERINQLVLKRDESLVKTLVNIEETTEKMTIAQEGSVKWHMENMPNKRDEYWTIWYLSRTGKTDELKRLLLSHQDVDERDPDFGYTALHYACRWNQGQVFEILLNSGANVLVTIPEDKRTPLHLASAYGTREMVLELLARGADYHALDAYGCTALDLAIQNKNTSVETTLKNWIHLIPADYDQQENTEEHEDIPEEYLSTPYEVLLTMSAPLRVITTRLEGFGNKSLETDLPLHVELRLCEKRAELCLSEGFKKEALKSKKRRWTSAKREYLKQGGASKNSEKEDEFIILPSFLTSICVDLYASLMLERDYLAAMKTLSDGLITLQGEKVRGKRARVYMLTRYSELLLYFYDHRNSSSESIDCDDERELRYGDGQRGKCESCLNEGNVLVTMSEEEAVEFIAKTAPARGLQLFPSLQTQRSIPSASPSISPDRFHLSAPASFISLPPLDRTNSIEETDLKKLFANSTPEVEGPFSAENHEILLRRMSECLREAISLNEEMFTESDSFVESVSLAPILELYSDCLDR